MRLLLEGYGKIFGQGTGDYVWPKAYPLTDRRPHINLLRACKQTNEEGTPIVYRTNNFVVGSESDAPNISLCLYI